MRQKLFFAVLLFSGFSNAQSLTQLNEPALNATTTMFVCDSAYSNSNSTNGSGVTWDFSNITGYTGNPSKVVSVLIPDTSIFTGSTKMTKIPGFTSLYWNSTNTDRSSQGLIFTELNAGKIVMKFTTDNEKLMDYTTFSLNGTLTDSYSGTLSNNMLTPTGPIPCTGSIVSTIDGQGTLKLPGANNYSNVLRHKVIENSIGTLNVFGMSVTTNVIRTQYDYYNTTSGNNLPIFSHTNIVISAPGFNKTVNLVLSAIQPGASQVTSTPVIELDRNKFSVYPNPSEGKITINGEFSSTASIEVTDYSGRLVSTLTDVKNGMEIDLTSVEKGMYLIVVTDNGLKTSKTVSIK